MTIDKTRVDLLKSRQPCYSPESSSRSNIDLFNDCLKDAQDSRFEANVDADEKGESYDDSSSNFSGNISERFLDEAQET